MSKSFTIKLHSDFQNALRYLLIANGITQKKLAELLNTTQQTVSRWCKGMCEPNYATLCEICNIFDVTPCFFFLYDSWFIKYIN